MPKRGNKEGQPEGSSRGKQPKTKDSVPSGSIDYQRLAAEIIRQQTELPVEKSDKNNDKNNAETAISESSSSTRSTAATVPNTERTDDVHTNTMGNQEQPGPSGSGSGHQMSLANVLTIFFFKVLLVR